MDETCLFSSQASSSGVHRRFVVLLPWIHSHSGTIERAGHLISDALSPAVRHLQHPFCDVE